MHVEALDYQVHTFIIYSGYGWLVQAASFGPPPLLMSTLLFYDVECHF